MIKVQETKNYDKFDLHPFNRNVKKICELEESMREHGWLDPYPLHCVRNGGDRLLIKAGHHRFVVANRLNIPVKYVISEDNVTIHELEKATNRWRLEDYLDSYVNMDKTDYIILDEYHKRTGIAISQCIALFSGLTGHGGPIREKFKSGGFVIVSHKQAEAVEEIVDSLRSVGMENPTRFSFVGALASFITLPQFDKKSMIEKIGNYPMMVKKCANTEDAMTMLEAVYNYKRHGDHVPLKTLAVNAGRKRQIKIRQGGTGDGIKRGI